VHTLGFHDKVENPFQSPKTRGKLLTWRVCFFSFFFWMASLSLSCSKNFCSQRKLNKIWMIPPFIRYTGTCIYLVFYAHIYISRVQSWKPLIFPGFPLAICRNFLAFFFSNKNCAYYDSPNALEASLLEFEGGGENQGKGGSLVEGLKGQPLLFKLLTLNPAKLSSRTQLPSGRD